MIALIEDMYGKCEIPLFGDDYVKFSPYFTENSFVCVTGKVDHGKFGGPNLRRSIIKVEFLSDVLKHGMVKSVTFVVDIEKMDNSMVDLIGDVLVSNKRKPALPDAATTPVVPVKFKFVDKTRRFDLGMSSQTYSVELGAKAMRLVDESEGAITMSVTM